MARERTVRVLVVDDDEDDYAITRALLAEAGGEARFDPDWAPTYDAGLAALGGASYDVCLVDYRLGEHDGLELLREAIAAGCKAPLILLTGQGDEAVDLEAMAAGAVDYLAKGQVDSRLLERSIRYAMERRRVEQMKDLLLAFASHELRTPVTAIKGFAQTILQWNTRGTAPLVKECLEHIVQAADSLTRLIDGFLDLSRVEAGQPVELVPAEFEVGAMVEEAVAIAAIAARRCTFTVHRDKRVSTLRGDRYKLLQVLVNLLSNADKYWPEGGEVRVHVDREVDHLRFAVADRGIGIPGDAFQAVFTPFYRVRDPRGHGARGTGIGLCLSRHLVEAHGGTIWVDSEAGQGTTVYFTVPA